jgi:hypothetical protein
VAAGPVQWNYTFAVAHQFRLLRHRPGIAFRLPFPNELRPILRVCIQGRAEGPLLRSRRAFQGLGRLPVVTPDELKHRYEEVLRQAPRGDVQAAHDRKRLFRRLLRQLGGISTDCMQKEFAKLLAALGISNGATFYTLRSSVTTAMKEAKLPHLELRYLTSHSTTDILNDYTTLDPVGAMRQYFDTIRPLLAAIVDRANALGLEP